MIVSCESCKSRYKLDDAKVTGRGAKITCPKCKHVFVVFSAQPAAPAAAAANPAAVDKNEWESDEPTRIGKMPVELRQAGKPPPPATVANVSVHEVTRVPSPAVESAATAPTVPQQPSPIKPADAASRASTLDFRKVGVTAWKVKVKIGLVYDFSDIKTLRKYISDGRVTQADVISHDGKSWKPLGEIPDLDAFFVETWERLNAEQVARGDAPKEGPAVQDLGKLAAELAASASAELARSENTPTRTGPSFSDPFDQLKARQRERAQQKQRSHAPEKAKTRSPLPIAIAVAALALLVVGWWATRPGETPPKPAVAAKAATPEAKAGKASSSASPDEVAAIITDVLNSAPEVDKPVAPARPEDGMTPIGPHDQLIPVAPTARPVAAAAATAPKPPPSSGWRDHYDVGESSARSGDWAGAALAYSNAVKAGGSTPDLFRKLGEAQHKSGNADGASSNLQKAVGMGDKSAPCTLGDVLATLGDNSGAVGAWTTCKQRNPAQAQSMQEKIDRLNASG